MTVTMSGKEIYNKKKLLTVYLSKYNSILMKKDGQVTLFEIILAYYIES